MVNGHIECKNIFVVVDFIIFPSKVSIHHALIQVFKNVTGADSFIVVANKNIDLLTPIKDFTLPLKIIKHMDNFFSHKISFSI